MDNLKPKNKIPALFTCKCPRCRQGDMFLTKNPYNFKKYMRMPETCPVCGDYFEKEVGFYYGSSYVSYGLTVTVSGITFVAWWLILGFSLQNNSLLYWLIANALVLIAVQPYMMRLARTIWLWIFVRYDKEWNVHPVEKPAALNDALKNAW